MDEQGLRDRLGGVLLDRWVATVAAGRPLALALAEEMAKLVLLPGDGGEEAERWREGWVAACAAILDTGLATMRAAATAVQAPSSGDLWQ